MSWRNKLQWKDPQQDDQDDPISILQKYIIEEDMPNHFRVQIPLQDVLSFSFINLNNTFGNSDYALIDAKEEFLDKGRQVAVRGGFIIEKKRGKRTFMKNTGLGFDTLFVNPMSPSERSQFVEDQGPDERGNTGDGGCWFWWD